MIDACSAMQNLRTAIFDVQLLAESALERKRDFFITRAKDYLERYCFLLMINAYLRAPRNDPVQSFSKWLQDKPEFTNMICDSIAGELA